MKQTRLSGDLLRVTAGFIVLTIALTYPQIRFMASRIGEHYDSLFSVWRLAWIAHQLPRDPLHLFDANIFYPRLHTLAYSDAILLPGVLGAPLIWLGVSPVFAHNALVLFSFVASGVAMYLLCRDLTGSSLAGWVGGVIFAFQPYRFGHYPQLELLWGWPIPLALWALKRALATGRVRDGLWLGVTIAIQALSCLYYAVFLVTSLIVLVAALLVGQRWDEIVRAIRPGLAASAVAAALVLPYALQYADTAGTRSEQEMGEWSPTLANYIATPPQNWLYGRVMGSRGSIEGDLFPGVAAVALALVGSLPPFTRRRTAYVALLLLAVDMSLGSHGVLYPIAYRTLWIYRHLRVPGRIFVIVSAALAVLAAEGVQRIIASIKSPFRRRAAGVSLVCVVLLESATLPLQLNKVPDPAGVYSWLAAQPRAVLMEWPMPHPASLGITHEPFYMFASTIHWQPIVNGYSGFYPLSYIRFLESTENFPSSDVVHYLRDASVRYVLLHSAFDPGAYLDARAALSNRSDIKLVTEERQGPDELALYRIAAE